MGHAGAKIDQHYCTNKNRVEFCYKIRTLRNMYNKAAFTKEIQLEW